LFQSGSLERLFFLAGSFAAEWPVMGGMTGEYSGWSRRELAVEARWFTDRAALAAEEPMPFDEADTAAAVGFAESVDGE
jgi:hypothetical protein